MSEKIPWYKRLYNSVKKAAQSETGQKVKAFLIDQLIKRLTRAR